MYLFWNQASYLCNSGLWWFFLLHDANVDEWWLNLNRPCIRTGEPADMSCLSKRRDHHRLPMAVVLPVPRWIHDQAPRGCRSRAPVMMVAKCSPFRAFWDSVFWTKKSQLLLYSFTLGIWSTRGLSWFINLYLTLLADHYLWTNRSSRQNTFKHVKTWYISLDARRNISRFATFGAAKRHWTLLFHREPDKLIWRGLHINFFGKTQQEAFRVVYTFGLSWIPGTGKHSALVRITGPCFGCWT